MIHIIGCVFIIKNHIIGYILCTKNHIIGAKVVNYFDMNKYFLCFFEDMPQVYITLLFSNVPLDDCIYYGLFLHQRIIVLVCIVLQQRIR